MDTIKLVVGGSNYDCGNTNTPADCTYEASSASSPAVTSISVSSSSELVFTGTTFDDAADSTVAAINGVESTSCTATTTTVTCTFGDHGIPVSADEMTPTLVFITGDLESYAVSTETISNPVGAITGMSGLECSFQGGCKYEISSTGLAAAAASSKDVEILMCDQECVLDEDNSDVDTLVCTLSPLMTTYSADEFSMAEAATLDLTWTGTADAT